MIKNFNNKSEKVGDDLKKSIIKGSKLDIAAAIFSIYGYESLKKELNGIERLIFIFTDPAFVEIDKIQEIEIFEINLKEKIIPKNVLKVIDKSIPYPILYIFTYNDDYSYGITLKGEKLCAPKEVPLGGNYYFSPWNENI